MQAPEPAEPLPYRAKADDFLRNNRQHREPPAGSAWTACREVFAVKAGSSAAVRQLNLWLKPASPVRRKGRPQKSESSIVSWTCWRWTRNSANNSGSLPEGRALVLRRASGVKDREMAREGYKLLRKFGNSKSRSIAKPRPTPSGGFGVSTEKSVGGTFWSTRSSWWPATAVRPEWMAKPSAPSRRHRTPSRSGWTSCKGNCKARRIGPVRCGGFTFPRATAANDRWAFPQSKT